MGPYFAGIFDPRSWSNESDAITLEVMRVVLATGLFAIGVELPKSYLAKHAKSLLAMVIPTMAIGWVIVAGACFFFSFSVSIACLNNVPTSRPASRIVSYVELHFVPCHFRLPHSYRPHHLCCYRWCDCLLLYPCKLVINSVPGGKFAQKHVPVNLRQLLSAESAANDGLAYPFLSLAIYLTLETTKGVAISHWILIGWLC
jgi:NhaP-type Na+/H+ or K+/H+ antiporter